MQSSFSSEHELDTFARECALELLEAGLGEAEVTELTGLSRYTVRWCDLFLLRLLNAKFTKIFQYIG